MGVGSSSFNMLSKVSFLQCFFPPLFYNSSWEKKNTSVEVDKRCHNNAWYCLSRNLVKKPGCYGASACKGLPGASVSIKKVQELQGNLFFFFFLYMVKLWILILYQVKRMLFWFVLIMMFRYTLLSTSCRQSFTLLFVSTNTI